MIEAYAAIALVVGWGFVLRTIGSAEVYLVLGPYAFACAVASLALRGRLAHTSQHKREPRWLRNVLLGVALGVVMTVGTYVAYDVTESFIPSLRSHVTELYSAAHVELATVAIAWTVVAIFAEELLFRGLLFEGLRSAGLSRFAAAGLAVVAYFLVQIGSGSVVIALAALVCGVCWTVERIFTRSLTAPIVSHLIWTIVVIHLHPVVR